MNKKTDIALIGCGKMGQAMLRGWLAADIAGHITILDPAPLPAECQTNLITHFSDAETFNASKTQPDILILAVKPQIMEDVCAAIAPSIPARTLILSIAAGQTIAGFERRFGEKRPIVRAMPNTPAAIGKGISVACANAHVTSKQKDLATAILHSIGQIEWVNDEPLLDAVTALSGSGPAYVFYLIEALAKAGENAGLDADFAMKLARQTVIGSAALAEAQPDIPASTLRENVTSPGGTTEAALEVLMNGEWQDILSKAIAAAAKRSKELRQ